MRGSPPDVRSSLQRRLRQIYECTSQPGDIADTVAFLLGPEASYITGQSLVVDGGPCALDPQSCAGVRRDSEGQVTKG